MQPSDVALISPLTGLVENPRDLHYRFLELAHPTRLSVEVASDLAFLVRPDTPDGILDRTTALRRQMVFEIGIVVPGIRFTEQSALPEGGYVIRLGDLPVAVGNLKAGRLLAVPGDVSLEDFPGEPSIEPIYGTPAFWIEPSQAPAAVAHNAGVYDAAAVVVIHLSEVIRSHAAELLGRQEVRYLLDHVARQQPDLVAAVTPSPLSLGEVRSVLQALLRERVAIRDIETILEALADVSATSRVPIHLLEGVRTALGRQIRQSHSDAHGVIHAVTVDDTLQTHLLAATRLAVQLAGTPPISGDTSARPLDHATAEGLVRAIADARKRARAAGLRVAIVVQPAVRLFLHRLLEPIFPDQAVLSWSEVCGPGVGPSVLVHGTVSTATPSESKPTQTE